MKIRKANKEDAKRLAELFLDFYVSHSYMGKFWLPDWAPEKIKNLGELMNTDAARRKTFEDVLGQLKETGMLIFVAEIDNKIVGYISFSIEKNDPWFKIKKYGFIDNTYTDIMYRRQGIAKKLIEFAENYFRKRGISHIMLKTTLQNEIAQKTWEHFGYKKELYVHLKELK